MKHICPNKTAERDSSTPTLDEERTASPAIFIEEVPAPKRRKMGDKGKEKEGFSVWADAGTTMARVNELLTPEEMKEISRMPSHKMVSQHVHKLVQVIFSCLVLLFFFFKPLLIQVLTALFIAKFWERQCTLLLNT